MIRNTMVAVTAGYAMEKFRQAAIALLKSSRAILAAAALSLTAACAATSAAHAVTYPITWNVTGTFDDLGTISGFFDINQYGYTNGTDWSLTTSAGTTLSGYSYSPGINASNPNVVTVQFTPPDHIYEVLLQLTFASSLLLPTANNPLIGGNGGPSFECLGFVCDLPDGDLLGTTRYIAEGYASAVPLPSALPLFASGLAGLGWLSRRRRRHATPA